MGFQKLIRRSRRRLLDVPAGRRVRCSCLSIRVPAAGTDVDLLATATLGLGRAPGQAAHGPVRIIIRFPAAWDERTSDAAARNTLRPLARYHSHEPLVLDFVILLLQAGHSRILAECAATALVCCVLRAEAERTGRGVPR